MTEEKRNRIVAAVTVNAILLIFILAAVLIYQMVIMVNLRAKRQQLLQEIAHYERLTEEGEDYFDRLQSEEFLRDKLIEYGWHFAD